MDSKGGASLSLDQFSVLKVLYRYFNVHRGGVKERSYLEWKRKREGRRKTIQRRN